MKLQMHEPRENQEEVLALPPILNTIDISSNMQFNFKLFLKNQPAPIKLKLEYIYIPTGESLNKAQLLQLKNFINFYCSKYYKNPQPLKADDHSHCTFDICFENCLPPKTIDIQSNEGNVPLIPFEQEWFYITIVALDLELLNDVRIEIRATAYCEKKVKKREPSKDVDSNQARDDVEDLKQFMEKEKEKEEKPKAKNKKNRLDQFKKDVG